MGVRVVTPAPKVSIRGLSMRFPTDGSFIEVLSSIDLDVKDGELVCILGPSGCGKSTLLNIVGGFLKATGGAVLIDGQEVAGPDPRRIFVFQERGVFPWLTVEGNVGFGLFRLGATERAERIAYYVKLVGLSGFENAYPQELSGGMKQRLEVARALAVNPDVLFLDEPFGALDSITRLVMRSELLRIRRAEKKTILFVTHDIDESVQLADRVVVMSTRPASIRRIVEIDMPHPRDLSSPPLHRAPRRALRGDRACPQDLTSSASSCRSGRRLSRSSPGRSPCGSRTRPSFPRP